MTQVSSPRVFIHSAKKLLGAVPRPLAAAGPDGGPYIQRGRTQNFVVSYEESLGTDGQTFADAVLAVCEQDYAQLQSIFGNISIRALPFSIYLRLGDSNNGGAYHYSCEATELYCFVTPGDSTELACMLVVAEEDEVFMADQNAGWNCGFSDGEGLSRILSTEFHPSALNGFASAASWLDGNRSDWINETEQTDQDYVSIGCSTLFLNYLHYQLGFGWDAIVQAGGETLAQTYANLTGTPDDPFTPFATLLQSRFPQGTPSGLQNDNPFPIRAQARPGSKYTVQEGDVLLSIARQAYGDDNLWHEIYIANTQVIGNNPNVLAAGKVLYLPHIRLIPQICTITDPGGLNVRAAPTTQSAIIASYPAGTALNFVEIVNGEDVAGNPLWGRSAQWHYFWMGATDRPYG